VLATTLVSCKPDKPVVTHSAPAPLHRGPLTDYVAAAGLRWLVSGNPSALARDDSFRPALSALFEGDRLEAFEKSSGIDLRRAPEALAAGFDLGTLYMVRLESPSASEVQRLFEERLLSGAIVKKPHPALTRVSGVVGQTPEVLVTIEARTVAVSVGDPTPARIAEAFARRRLKSSPTALRGSALATLPDLSSATVRFFAPGPFPDRFRSAAGGLLEAALAIGAALRPAGPGRARLEIFVSGDWSVDPEGAAERLSATYRSLIESSTGDLLGLKQGSTPTTRATDDLLTLQVELELEPIARGLRAAVLADPTEIFGFPTEQPADSSSGTVPGKAN
jgi:hypothetical protein